MLSLVRKQLAMESKKIRIAAKIFNEPRLGTALLVRSYILARVPCAFRNISKILLNVNNKSYRARFSSNWGAICSLSILWGFYHIFELGAAYVSEKIVAQNCTRTRLLGTFAADPNDTDKTGFLLTGRSWDGASATSSQKTPMEDTSAFIASALKLATNVLILHEQHYQSEFHQFTVLLCNPGVPIRKDEEIFYNTFRLSWEPLPDFNKSFPKTTEICSNWLGTFTLSMLCVDSPNTIYCILSRVF